MPLSDNVYDIVGSLVELSNLKNTDNLVCLLIAIQHFKLRLKPHASSLRTNQVFCNSTK